MAISSESPERRARRPRGSLTVEGILDAAERVASGGFDAMTVRAVAADMQASPMALYRYFNTKEELVDALLDRVLGRFVLPSPTDDWIADLRAFAKAHRTMLVEHAWAIAPLFTHPSPGMNAVRIGEAALRILSRGDVVGGRAVAAFSGIIALNYGWSAFATQRPDDLDDDSAPNLGDMLHTLPIEAFPLTIAVADDMAGYGSDTHYDQVLGDLLVGLSASTRKQWEQ